MSTYTLTDDRAGCYIVSATGDGGSGEQMGRIKVSLNAYASDLVAGTVVAKGDNKVWVHYNPAVVGSGISIAAGVCFKATKANADRLPQPVLIDTGHMTLDGGRLIVPNNMSDSDITGMVEQLQDNGFAIVNIDKIVSHTVAAVPR